MGYLGEMLREGYENLVVRDVYTTKLGDTDVEIVEVSTNDRRFIAMFQSRPLKEGIFKWSLIITSPNNTRTLKGMDPVSGIKLALKSSIEAMMRGMEE